MKQDNDFQTVVFDPLHQHHLVSYLKDRFLGFSQLILINLVLGEESTF